MTPFLKQVADHYFRAGDVGERCFVFPNKRSMTFFRKYLCEAVAADSATPVAAPEMVTVNDFFSLATGMSVTDRITLIVRLYECYRKINSHAESLDEFIFWGDVLLGDFNDVDKYLAEPAQIFANIADFRNIRDDFEYLTQTQKKAIAAFAGHFLERKEAKAGSKDVKESFLQIWNILLPLYRSFNDSMEQDGLAYEGMVYRKLAEKSDSMPVADILAERFRAGSFVFVGLNALNECERKVLGKMRDAGIAEFCWDYTGRMISDPLNKSSFFMAHNVIDFPQAFHLEEEPERLPEFNVISVPSSYGQVKHVPYILEKVGNTDSGVECAVVLPDEGLLMPLLNSIPPSVKDINVTMGYPMDYSEIWAFMNEILKMQLHLRIKGDKCFFYHKHVWNIFANPLFKKLLSGDGMKDCRDKVNEIRKAARYYVSEDELGGFPLLELIFRPVVRDHASDDPAQTDALSSYQQEILAFVATRLAGESDMPLEAGFAKEYWCVVNRLKAMRLPVRPVTYVRLLDSLLSGIAVPFAGEPLKGLQIMGPLETRALDFKTVIILSCNEGIFPRRSVSSSFIPPELRKGFGLPTYEYQDAVWAYYFYRLVARSENVWMIYDSRTEGLKSGEESRYIKQLRYHFNVPVNMYVPDMNPGMPSSKESIVRKDSAMLAKIRSGCYSPSALQNYIDCPMRFYYYSVQKLKKDREVAESMDPAMMGNVYHNVMWALFTSEAEMLSERPFDKLERSQSDAMKRVSRSYLESWIGREEEIRKKVVSLMCAELGTDEISGRNIVVASVIVRYVCETLKRDVQILEQHGEDFFEIVGLELPVDAELYGLKFFGVMDRIDRIGGTGNVRLVDYKSGKDDPSVLMVTDASAETVADDIFGADRNRRKKSKAGLQFFIYDRMLQEKGIAELDTLSNSMYSTSELFSGVPQVCPLNARFAAEMDKRLQTLLAEIQNPDMPFTMTEDEENCRWCDFKMLCGR